MDMSDEERAKWSRDREDFSKEMPLSPSCSSFQMDPHDAGISRLATDLFRKTNEYLHGEMTAGQDHYDLMQELNRMTITKYSDLRSLAINLSKSLNECSDVYRQQIKPLLHQIDMIDRQVSAFELSAYRLDSYTKQLKCRFKEIEEK